MARDFTPERELLHPLVGKETRSNGIVLTRDDKHRQVKDLPTEVARPFNGFGFAALDKIAKAISGTWTMWNLRVPDAADSPEEHAKWKQTFCSVLKGFRPTHGWRNKDHIVVLQFRDGEGNVMAWGDLKVVAFDMTDKLDKRMSMLGWQSYFSLDIPEVVFYTEEELGERVIPVDPTGQTVSILIRQVSEEEFALKDGRSQMRPEMRDRLIANMNVGDEDRADHLRDQALHTWRWQSRFLTERGQIKCNFLVAREGVLPTDFVIYEVKSEIRMTNSSGLLIAIPVEQKRYVRTSRQLLAVHWWMFSEDLLERFHNAEIDNMLVRFKAGEINHQLYGRGESGSSYDIMYNKLRRFKAAGLKTNASLRLQMEQVEAMSDHFRPAKGKDDARKFWLPNGFFVSTASWSDLVDTGFADGLEEPADGEGFIDSRFGLIVSDATYLRMVPLNGGKDKDDHDLVLVFNAGGDDPTLDIRKGDLIMPVVRYPIGVAGNGRQLAREYFVVKATKKFAHEVRRNKKSRHFVESQFIPTLDLTNRPPFLDEVEFGDPTFIPVPRTRRPQYDQWEFLTSVEEMIDVMRAYGDHSNMRMAAAMYDVPLVFDSYEEKFIDVQQSPSIATKDAMDIATTDMARQIKTYLEVNGLAMDALLFNRVKNYFRGVDIDSTGLFCRLADIHKAGVARLNREIREYLRGPELLRHIKMVNDVEVTIKLANGTPKLLELYWRIEKEVRRDFNRQSMDLHASHFIEIGDRVVSYMDNAGMSHEFQIQAVRELHAYLIRATRHSRNSAPQSCLQGTDMILLNGRLLDLYIEVLQSYRWK